MPLPLLAAVWAVLGSTSAPPVDAPALPDILNPSVAEGRLFAQPIDIDEPWVHEGLQLSVATGTQSEYAVHFRPASNPEHRITVNSHFYTLRAAYGRRVAGMKLAVGGQLRAYQDMQQTVLSEFLAWFHRVTEPLGVKGYIPPEGAYDGTVGNVSVIGSSGSMALLTGLFYAKAQLLEQVEAGVDLSLKLSWRPAFSGHAYDRSAWALSTGLARRLLWGFHSSAAVSVTRTGLRNADFQDANLQVRSWGMDAFVGLSHEGGGPGGFFIGSGLRVSTWRLRYADLERSNDDQWVIYLNLGYAFDVAEGHRLLWTASAAEDLMIGESRLHPDIALHTRLTWAW